MPPLTNPYAAPKTEVRDVQPERKSYWLRTLWFYVGFSTLIAAGGAVLNEPLASGVTPVSSALAFLLLALLCAKPLEVMAKRRSGSFPWWWDVLFYGVAGLFVLGSAVDDEGLMFTAYATIGGMSVVTVISTWIVERRHPVRVYSTARGVVFVREEEA